MPKEFRHLGEDWQASGTGRGVGVGFGGDSLPAVNRWSVVFRSKSRPDRGEYRAVISAPDPNNVSETELRGALEEQLILAAINRSRYIWRPAEAIARETGIDAERVRFVLENTIDDVIAGDQNSEGFWLYTTREHLSKTTGDVMKRFYQIEETS